MHFRQIYFFIIILGLIITGCEKLTTDPGDNDTDIQTTDELIYWGGSYDDFGHVVIQTADGGYAVVGSQYSSLTQNDLVLVKFNSSLVFESDTSYGGDNAPQAAYNNVANDLQQTLDGGYILVGSTFNGTDDDVWVVKYTPQLTLAWEDTIKGLSHDVGNSVQETADGGFLVCGTSYDGNDYDIMLWKIASDGLSYQILYSETTLTGSTDNNTNDFGNYAQELEGSGGYIITGSSFSATNSNDIRLIKLNSVAGTISLGFDSTYNIIDGFLGDDGIFVQPIDDEQGFVVVGNYWASGYGQNNVFILKTDVNGAESTPIATFGGGFDDFGNCVMQTSDKGFIITGSKLSQNTSDKDVWVLKVTHDLSSEWEYKYGGNADDEGKSVKQTTDGGYIITGNTYSYGNQSEIILLKIDREGKAQDFSE